jgi:hypothetical protein
MRRLVLGMCLTVVLLLGVRAVYGLLVFPGRAFSVPYRFGAQCFQARFSLVQSTETVLQQFAWSTKDREDMRTSVEKHGFRCVVNLQGELACLGTERKLFDFDVDWSVIVGRDKKVKRVICLGSSI